MGGGRRQLRAWLEYIAQSAIDWLDDLDAADAEREDDGEGGGNEDGDGRSAA